MIHRTPGFPNRRMQVHRCRCSSGCHGSARVDAATAAAAATPSCTVGISGWFYAGAGICTTIS